MKQNLDSANSENLTETKQTETKNPLEINKKLLSFKHFLSIVTTKFNGFETNSNIDSLAKIWGEIKNDLYSEGKNPAILIAIWENGFINEQQLNNKIIERIKISFPEVCLTKLAEKEFINPENPVLENPENTENIEIPKTIPEKLAELQNFWFFVQKMSKSLPFLELLSLKMLNFQINFVKSEVNYVDGKPKMKMSLDFVQEIDTEGFLPEEKEFQESLADYQEIKELEKVVATKIEQIRQSEDLWLFRILGDKEVMNEFAKTWQENCAGNDVEIMQSIAEFRNMQDLNNYFFQTFFYYGLDVHLLKNTLIKKERFYTFIQTLEQFVELIKSKRNFFGGNMQKDNWSESGVKIGGLIGLKNHLKEIEKLVRKIDYIASNRPSSDTIIDSKNLPMNEFVDQIIGMKLLEDYLGEESRKFHDILYDIIDPKPLRPTHLDYEARQNNKNNLGEKIINSQTLIEVLHRLFIANNI